MDVVQLRRERLLLESRMIKMVELFEKKTGTTVQSVGLGEVRCYKVGQDPKHSQGLYLGRGVSVIVHI